MGQLDLHQSKRFCDVYMLFTNAIRHIPFQDTPFDWIEITDCYGRWAWYRGLVVDGDAEDATVLATWHMFSSCDEWDVYIGSGHELINRADMIYADAA